MNEKKFTKNNKKVNFNDKVEVHVMRTYLFAHKQSRKGTWHLYAIDR